MAVPFFGFGFADNACPGARGMIMCGCWGGGVSDHSVVGRLAQGIYLWVGDDFGEGAGFADLFDEGVGARCGLQTIVES